MEQKLLFQDKLHFKNKYIFFENLPFWKNKDLNKIFFIKMSNFIAIKFLIMYIDRKKSLKHSERDFKMYIDFDPRINVFYHNFFLMNIKSF